MCKKQQLSTKKFSIKKFRIIKRLNTLLYINSYSFYLIIYRLRNMIGFVTWLPFCTEHSGWSNNKTNHVRSSEAVYVYDHILKELVVSY